MPKSVIVDQPFALGHRMNPRLDRQVPLANLHIVTIPLSFVSAPCALRWQA